MNAEHQKKGRRMAKNQKTKFADVIARAQKDFYVPDGKDLIQKNPYYRTSDNSDVYLLTMAACYAGGLSGLTYIHKSRGYRWDIEINFVPVLGVMVNNAARHPSEILNN
jgi:hypothetical protein